jgi:hypothetical protein
VDTEFLIFSELDQKLINLPSSLKEIWIYYDYVKISHKLPLGCTIKNFRTFLYL